jgi:glycosyltransferase
MNSISIITATLNSIDKLPYLATSLKSQSDKKFKWIICDGGSTDGTIEFINRLEDMDIELSIQKDFGIYDAINRGVNICESSYYLTVGSDDNLNHKAIESYKSELADQPDLIFSKIYVGSELRSPSLKSGWLRGMNDQGGCHSVGTLIKTRLHECIGMYSNNYPICADRLFIGKCFKFGVKTKCADFIAGNYSVYGASGSERLAVFTESYRIQIELGYNKFVQTLIFFMKIIKNYNNI